MRKKDFENLTSDDKNEILIMHNLEETHKTISNSLKIKIDAVRQVIKEKDSEATGLGDTIENITKSTGIKKVVKWLFGEKDCGCEDRKLALNKFFRYNKFNWLNKEEFDWFSEFKSRKNKNTLSAEDTTFIFKTFCRVFNQSYPEKWCTCNKNIYIDAIAKLKKLHDEMEDLLKKESKK